MVSRVKELGHEVLAAPQKVQLIIKTIEDDPRCADTGAAGANRSDLLARCGIAARKHNS